MSTSDPFEEFEFRPLTEGLGFHRQSEKKQPPASSVSSSPGRPDNSLQFKPMGSALPEIEMPLSARGSALGLNLDKNLEAKPALRRAPLDEMKPQPAVEPGGSTTVDDILKTLQTKRKFDFKEGAESVSSAAGASPKKLGDRPALAYRNSVPDFSSFVLDGMLVTAGSLACLIILLLVTKVDLFGVLTQTDDMTVYIALASLFTSIAWIFLTMTRVFMGFTPGEWVFDQRIDLPQNHGTTMYVLHVLARTTLVVATGLVTLPILSLIMRQDLAGLITRAPLLKKV
jgi:hypothetical protein